MRYIPFVLMLLIPYGALIADFAIVAMEGGLTAVAVTQMVTVTFAICFPVLVVLAILTGALVRKIGFSLEDALCWGMVLKLANIPLYLGMSLIVILFVMFVWTIPLAIALAIGLYLLIMPSGIVCLFNIVRAKRAGILKTSEAVLASLGLFFTVFDVVSALCVFVTFARRSEIMKPHAVGR